MAGILLLWLCLEGVASCVTHAHIAFFSDNSPTVSWVERLASRKSRVAARLVRALSLRLNIHRACPLTPVHIPGVENALADIPSRSFGSNPEWFCPDDSALLTLFSQKFPLPHQASWTTFHFTTKMITRLISVLQMKDFTLAEWRRLPKIGQNIGDTGQDLPASGIGPLFTGGWVHATGACPHRVRRARPQRCIRQGEVSPGWHSHWRYHVRWAGDRAGLWREPNKTGME
jgi:hypothetical protein